MTNIARRGLQCSSQVRNLFYGNELDCRGRAKVARPFLPVTMQFLHRRPCDHDRRAQMDQPALAAELPFLRTMQRSEPKNHAAQPERLGPVWLPIHGPRISIGFDVSLAGSSRFDRSLSKRHGRVTKRFNVWRWAVV